MFGFFGKEMTERSNHYVDWSRVGELLKSGTHRYSKDELIVRSGIVVCTAVSAYLAVYLNGEDKSLSSNILVATFAGLVGCLVAHAPVVLPLLKKRCDLEKECNALIDEIENKLNMNAAMTEQNKNSIRTDMKNIMNLSLSDDKHARASQTWGRRKHLLQELNEQLYSRSNSEILNNSLACTR